MDIRQKDREAQEKMAAYLAAHRLKESRKIPVRVITTTSDPSPSSSSSSSSSSSFSSTSSPPSQSQLSNTRFVQPEVPQIPEFHRSPNHFAQSGLVVAAASSSSSDIPSPPPSPLINIKSSTTFTNTNTSLSLSLASTSPASQQITTPPVPARTNYHNQSSNNMRIPRPIQTTSRSRSPTPIDLTKNLSTSNLVSVPRVPPSPNSFISIGNSSSDSSPTSLYQNNGVFSPSLPELTGSSHLGLNVDMLDDHSLLSYNLDDLKPKVLKLSPAPWMEDSTIMTTTSTIMTTSIPEPPSPTSKPNCSTTPGLTRNRSKSCSDNRSHTLPSIRTSSTTRHIRNQSSESGGIQHIAIASSANSISPSTMSIKKSRKLLNLFTRQPKRYQNGTGITPETVVLPDIPTSLPSIEIEGPSIVDQLPNGFFSESKDNLINSMNQVNNSRVYSNDELYRILKNMQKAYQVMVFELHSQICELKTEIDRFKTEPKARTLDYARANGFSRPR